MRALIISLLMVWAPLVSAAETTSNNAMIKGCLDAYGYDYSLPVEERLNNFDWNSAADCVSNYRVEDYQEKVVKIQQTLKEKPWLKGRNWQWELRSEYRCTVLRTELGPREVCSRPAYIN